MRKRLLFFIMFMVISIPMVSSELVPRDFYLEVSKGNIPGHSHIHKFGHNPSVGNTWTDVWDNDTIYNFLAVPTRFNVSSTDANDDNGDTGAWNVTLLGLDANFALLNESITLDGQNNVTTTGTYIRIYRAIVGNSGSSETNEGDIYIGNGPVVGGICATVYAQIPADMGQTLMAIYTIPENKTGFLYGIYIATDEDKIIDIALFTRPPGGSWNVKERVHLFRQEWQHEYLVPRRYEERTDIVIRAQTGVGTASVSAGWNMVLVGDNVLSNSTLTWADGSVSNVVISGTVSTTDPTVIFATFIGIVAFGLLAIGIWRRRR